MKTNEKIRKYKERLKEGDTLKGVRKKTAEKKWKIEMKKEVNEKKKKEHWTIGGYSNSIYIPVTCVCKFNRFRNHTA